MNSRQLKILGCVSMLIDHITYCFIPQKLIETGEENVWFYIGRGIGRSSLLIFAFLLVEGFYHTQNVKKYMLRLLIAAAASEAAFDFMGERFSLEKFLEKQNVLFLFLIAILIMYVLDSLNLTYYKEQDRYKSEGKVKALTPFAKYNIFASLTCVFGFLAAYYLKVDFGIIGLALILIFYFFRNGGGKLVAAVVVWSVACLFMNNMLEWAGLIALVPIVKFYNGERGKGSKWLFYLFYPLHMVILGLIKLLI